MRLKIHFGSYKNREVIWWQPIEKFPHLISFEGKKWEFFMYDRGIDGSTDYDCQFSEVGTWDNMYWSHEFTPWETITGEYGPKCECGSAHTSAPQLHMFYCPMWTKVEIL